MSVVDTSVYIALVNKGEIAHEGSWHWLRKAVSRNEVLIAPVVLMTEAAAAISRGVGDLALARQVVQQLRQSSLITLIPIDQALADLAAMIAIKHRIRGCDALFVALAQQRSLPLVTLDKQQQERGQAVVSVIEPQ